MFKKLAKVANQLDQKGLYEEASQIDLMIKIANPTVIKSNLIKALQDDDAEAAAQAITDAMRTGTRLNDLFPVSTGSYDNDGNMISRPMTDEELGRFLKSVDPSNPNLDVARQMVGVPRSYKPKGYSGKVEMSPEKIKEHLEKIEQGKRKLEQGKGKPKHQELWEEIRYLQEQNKLLREKKRREMGGRRGRGNLFPNLSDEERKKLIDAVKRLADE